jgi:predicted nucleic acid-binding protein
MLNVVDTSGWLEYFFGGRNAGFFSPPIEDSRRLLVPAVCLYEVFKKVLKTADEARALQAVTQMKQGQVVPVTEEIALRAATISLKHRLPMADSLVYATAVGERALVWTQDEDFARLPNVRFRPARAGKTRSAPR